MQDDFDEAAEPAPDADDNAGIDQRYIVPGLARGLSVLHLFDKEQKELKLAELAEGAGLTRSAAFRLIYTLEKEGYLRRDPTARRYALTSKILSLGFVYLNSQPLVEIIHPYLRRLSQLTRAASHLVQLDGMYAVYLARVAPPVTLVSNLQVGQRLPAYATASGRVLLSGLDDRELAALHRQMRQESGGPPLPPLSEIAGNAREDRERGYVMKESIFDPGVLSFAAPIRNGAGTIVAAINVVGPRSVMEGFGGADRFSEIVGSEAAALSETLGFVKG